MFAAKLHRSRCRCDRNFQHRHDDRAFGDSALGSVHGGGIQELVRAHVENNEILAFFVQDDEADAGRPLLADREMGRVDRLCGVEVGRNARKLSVPIIATSAECAPSLAVPTA